MFVVIRFTKPPWLLNKLIHFALENEKMVKHEKLNFNCFCMFSWKTQKTWKTYKTCKITHFSSI